MITYTKSEIEKWLNDGSNSKLRRTSARSNGVTVTVGSIQYTVDR